MATALLTLVATPLCARAQPAPGDEALEDEAPAPRLPDPTYILESVVLDGDYATSDSIILDALGLETGQPVTVELLKAARLRLLATGFFEQAQFGLERGSQRGHVVLRVTLEERNTVLLTDVFLGTSERSTFWGGVDVVDGNMFGVGHTARAAFVTSGEQLAFEVGYEDPSLFGTDFSLAVAGHFSSGSELAWPVRIEPGLGGERFEVDVLRGGGRLSAGYRPLPLLGIFLDVRVLRIEAQSSRPALLEPVVRPGNSTLLSSTLAVELDTRDDPVMPRKGLRLNLAAEGATSAIASDYEFVKLLGQFNAAWEFVPGHILRFDLVGGGIFGQAPFFERFFAGDFNDFIPARNLGLNFANRPAIDFFNTGADQLGYETIVARASLEYAIPILAGIEWLYRTEFFIGGGVWGATTPQGERAGVILGLEPIPGVRDPFPLDLTVDLGIRVETEIGIFGLSFANALALIPF